MSNEKKLLLEVTKIRLAELEERYAILVKENEALKQQIEHLQKSLDAEYAREKEEE